MNRRAWQTFWFDARTPGDLAVCRILFFGGVLLLWGARDLGAWSSIDDIFWQPIWIFRVFRVPRLDGSVIEGLQWLWMASLVASCVGLWTRVSMGTAFVLGVYLIGLPHNVGKIHHSDAVVVLIMGIMAFARAGDAWSIDSWRRPRPTKPDGEYTWPLQLARVVLAFAFFAAGVAKLRISGLAWLTPENLATMMTVNYYQQASSDPLTSWGLVVAQWPSLCFAGAVGTLVVELGYPLALVSRLARVILVPGAVALLIAIRFLMGPAFGEFALCHVVWVPWTRLGRWMGLGHSPQ